MSTENNNNELYNNSIKIKGIVKFISDGSFQYKGKVYTGRLVQMGRCVVIKVNNINILIAEKTMPTTDPEPVSYTHLTLPTKA